MFFPAFVVAVILVVFVLLQIDFVVAVIIVLIISRQIVSSIYIYIYKEH